MSPSFYLCAEEGVGPCVAADMHPCCELLEFMFLIRSAQVTASHGLRVRRFAGTGCHDAPRRWQAGCSCNSRRHRDSGLGRREEGAGYICTLKGVPAVILGPPGRADRAHHGADTWILPTHCCRSGNFPPQKEASSTLTSRRATAIPPTRGRLSSSSEGRAELSTATPSAPQPGRHAKRGSKASRAC